MNLERIFFYDEGEKGKKLKKALESLPDETISGESGPEGLKARYCLEGVVEIEDKKHFNVNVPDEATSVKCLDEVPLKPVVMFKYRGTEYHILF